MIEIHSHILPGLDDGPATSEEALLLAQSAVDAGITKIIATPHHLNESYDNPRHEVEEAVRHFNVLLQECDIPLQIRSGQEIRLHPRLMELWMNEELLTLASSKYMLLELPYHEIPAYFGDLLHELRIRNIIPIIAHPERNAVLLREPDRLRQYMRDGVLCQITAQSFLGLFGRKVQKWCFHFCKQNGFHFISSDAHDLKQRNFALKAAYERIEERFGTEMVNQLQINARRVWDDRLVELAEPANTRRRLLLW
ncbi:CpsB/CapC family capsule biosynthesis tyrosine phosphatase [Paenibacillus sp. Marseille-Q4541]|uniref:tyrosine-protein phosphatase n=1 Tax=Paenibacillus sp. Marseille-Q4541 TaxID=2831522 RepID=UPI001BA98C29|nr:CpsB/CapC family capsule biosynthesis tyrosine phosphatase [Paenibacillus sp. Marseille-Q4541]